MEKLSKEEILHVAKLAHLNITEDEIEKYSIQLRDILSEIDKINEVQIEENDILIAPTNNRNVYFMDEPKEMLSKEEVLKNANNKNEDFIIVPRVIND